MTLRRITRWAAISLASISVGLAGVAAAAGDNGSLGGPEDQNDPEQIAVQQLLATGASRADFADCLAALGVGRILVLHEADWQSYGDLARRPGLAVERSWPGVTLYRSSRPASLVMARTGAGLGCRDWTPVPARRDGPLVLRLLSPVPAGAPVRVELPYGTLWRASGADVFSYGGWVDYRRNYIIGGLALLLVCGLPFGRRWLGRRRRRASDRRAMPSVGATAPYSPT